MAEKFQIIPEEVAPVLAKVLLRQEKGHPQYYRPLEKHESQIIRKWYEAGCQDFQLEGPVLGVKLVNKLGTVIATGYSRIVIGDYGAYFEIPSMSLLHAHIENKWPGKPTRPVKYIWMQTKDSAATKVYHQLGRVKYADYKPGMYYVAVEDVRRPNATPSKDSD